MVRLPKLPEDVDFNKIAMVYGMKDDGTYVAIDVGDDGRIRTSELEITQELTYILAGNGKGEIATIKEYPTGALEGSPANLTTFTYDEDDNIIERETIKTTV